MTKSNWTKLDTSEKQKVNKKNDTYVKGIGLVETKEKPKTKTTATNLLNNEAGRMSCIQYIATRQEDKATELASTIIKENNFFDSIKQDKITEIWYYNEGIRKPNGESHIKEKCRKIFGEAYTPQRANKVIAKIEADTFINAELFFKKEQENIWEIPTQNGILNIKTRELSPFTPEKYFFNKINASYIPNTECPKIKKFLSDVLSNNENIKVAYETIGHTLVKKYLVQAAVFLYGGGENAKGVFESLIRNFLGIENCSSLPLGQLTPDSFSCCELFGKLANLAGDISNTDFKDTGRFKELTSGTDLIAAKRKFQRDLFFINYAKFFNGFNEFPRVYDHSHGFWRRCVILEFPYKFIKESEYNKLEDKSNTKLADTEIINKLITKDELSGLLNKCLDGLDRILKNKEFSYTKSTADVKDFWIRKSDSFTAFCFDKIEENIDGFISKKDLRKKFNKYCRKYKIKGASDKNIKFVLEDLFGVIEARKNIKLGDFERERVWEGIVFKSENINVHNVHSILPIGVNGNMPIGSKPMDSMDILQKTSKNTQKSDEIKENITKNKKIEENDTKIKKQQKLQQNNIKIEDNNNFKKKIENYWDKNITKNKTK